MENSKDNKKQKRIDAGNKIISYHQKSIPNALEELRQNYTQIIEKYSIPLKDLYEIIYPDFFRKPCFTLEVEKKLNLLTKT